MEGIEILSIGEIGINPVFNWPVAIICGSLLALIPAVGVFIGDENLITSIIVFIVCAILFGTLLGFAEKRNSETVPTYKVIISDTVSLNEFYDRYEILEQDGKIFTVMEKQDE